MNFKEYLNEKEFRSEKIFQWIKYWRIPISPKFWKETFGDKEQYCFQAIEPDRIDSLFKRQHKKNQVSTFTEWRSTNIFWGADGMDWAGSQTLIAILKGKVTVQGSEDLWTFFEKNGRRWIDVKSMLASDTGSDLALTMYLVQTEIKKNFKDKIKHSRYRFYFDFEKSPNKDIIFDEKLFTNKDNREIIQWYFDITYDAIKKYKKKIQKGAQEQIKYSYNEHLCYDYTVQEVLVILEDDKDLDQYDDAKDVLRKVQKYTNKTSIVSVKETEKILKEYRKKNKDLK